MKEIMQFIFERSKPRTKVYLMCGLPGSGKSEWCKRNHPELPIVSRDIIRGEFGFTSGVDEKARLENWQENKVTEKEKEYIKRYIKQHQDFIIDDTNLRLKYRKQMIQSLRDLGAYIIGVRIDTPLELCIKRRDGQINSERMEDIYKKMTPLQEDEVDELIIVK